MAAQTMKWDSNTTLEKEDIQGLLVRGYSKLPYASYHLLRFNDLKDAKSYLHESITQVTKASTSPDDMAVHLAFTYDGLKYLSLPEITLQSFLRQFKEGMTEKHRSFVLGDEHANAPELWEWGGPNNPPVHALLMLYTKDKSTLEAVQSQHHTLFGHHHIEEVRMLATDTLPDLKEHFGFRDGVSQPYVGGFSNKQPGENEDILPPGEFVLGYKNWYGQYPDSPIMETESDADDLLPSYPNNLKVKDFGMNGSYLVFRQLSQDVYCFWKYMKEQAPAASHTQKEAVKLASKMVGRWPSGAPLVKAPHADDVQYANHNDFNYWKEDFNGLKCPIGAHIRRTNPRDSLLTEKTDLESKEMVLKHRILRRGRTYGTPLAESMKTDDLMNAEDDGKERGLHFICFVGDLIRQFEFIQNAWVKFHKFGGLYEDSDPLIGTHYQKDGHVTDTFTVPEEPVRKRYKNMPQFTAVKGGAYFFFPGIKALTYLSRP
ncbi:Dyp-type peroxidase [Echinicola arenosa]|nr:peroxidase [Echinicola arenosa]